MRSTGCAEVDRITRVRQQHRRRKLQMVDRRVERRDDGHWLVITYAAGPTIEQPIPRRQERRGHRLAARVRRLHRLRRLWTLAFGDGDHRVRCQLRQAETPDTQQRRAYHALVAEQAANSAPDPTTRLVTSQSTLHRQCEPPPPPCDVDVLLDAPRPGPAAGVAFRVA